MIFIVILRKLMNGFFEQEKALPTRPIVYFNDNPVSLSSTDGHFRMILGSKLNYEYHLQSVLNMIDKIIGCMLLSCHVRASE